VKAGVFEKLGFQPATYNPLDLLDRNDPNAVAIAESLALAICPLKGSKEDYWTESAASLLTAVLLWLTDELGETKTLARARDIVTRSRKDLRENFLVKMATSKAFSGAIRENAASFIDLAQETYSGVISNLNTQTKFLSDPQIKANTATSSFSMRDLTDKPVTVYVIIPPGRVRAQRTWLRLVISAAMQTFKQQEAAPPQRCMFLIDELPALGRLDDLPDDISSMRGYGVDFTLIVQGLDQLKARYGEEAATIINNCHYKWFCNIGDLESAKYLSQSLGKRTVETTSKSTSFGHNPGGGSSGESTTHGETGRDLLMPDEILNLGRDTAILLNPMERPQYLRPIDYWDLPAAFAHLKEGEAFSHMYWGKLPLRYDPNPYRILQK
jgi:type IV secretory pathway TraG/TraD family ATPase VirD4